MDVHRCGVHHQLVGVGFGNEHQVMDHAGELVYAPHDARQRLAAALVQALQGVVGSAQLLCACLHRVFQAAAGGVGLGAVLLQLGRHGVEVLGHAVEFVVGAGGHPVVECAGL